MGPPTLRRPAPSRRPPHRTRQRRQTSTIGPAGPRRGRKGGGDRPCARGKRGNPISGVWAMASLLSPPQLRELEEVFRTYDTSGEGGLDTQELGVMLRALGLHCTEAEVQDIVSLVDSDGSGKLDFAEFTNLMASR